tara:strand:- start:12808 stop:14442 length:1635 start_codon:yes stop_codon:yes gene_type:complete
VLTAKEQIDVLVDAGSFKESSTSIVPPSSVQNASELSEATITGVASIGGVLSQIISLDHRFFGGTIGTISGEKIALAFENATRKKLPIVALLSTGQTENRGLIQLMQIPKILVTLNNFKDKRLPYICVMANVVTGQSYSSLGSLADIVFGEKGAMIGLAPERTDDITNEPYGNSFNQGLADIVLNHGMIDKVIDRRKMRDAVIITLHVLCNTKNKVGAKMDALLGSIQEWKKTESSQIEELWPSSWQAVPLSEENQRPTSSDLINRTFDVFIELHGDRLYGDDPAVIAGLGLLETYPVLVIGQERGHDISARRRHEGRTNPEGFRKAQRIMHLSSRLGMPLLSLIDSPGPNYGRDSEERGIGSAIAFSTETMLRINAPTISVIVSNTGSEGALAFCVSDIVMMYQNAIYTIESPFESKQNFYRNRLSGDSVQFDAEQCKEFSIIDEIIEEPAGGANRNPQQSAINLKDSLLKELQVIVDIPIKTLLKERSAKFRQSGEYSSVTKERLIKEKSNIKNYVSTKIQVVQQGRRFRKAARKRKSLNQE